MNKRFIISRKVFRYQHVFFAGVFSFILGSLLTLNLASINKTCKLDDTDREYNVMKQSYLKTNKLVALIFSSPENLSKRNTIRLTWLKLQQNENNSKGLTFSHYFVLGKFGLNGKSYENILNEQSLYGDILLLPMYDGYNNLTEKLLKTFIWLKEQRDMGFDFQYVLKCDDDSFVKVHDTLQELSVIENFYLNPNVNVDQNYNLSPYISINKQVNKNKEKKINYLLYWGYFNGKGKLKKSGKWQEDNWISCDNYIPYALGGGYVLSKDLVLYLANNAEFLQLYKSEDVSIGTWLSPVTNIIRVHDVRFDTEWTSRGCQNYHLIAHHISEKQMHEFYYNIHSTGRLCSTERQNRVPYLYNWKKRPSECCNELIKKKNLLDNIISLFPLRT